VATKMKLKLNEHLLPIPQMESVFLKLFPRSVFSLLSVILLLASLIASGFGQSPIFSINLSSDKIAVGNCAELIFTIQNESDEDISDLAFQVNLPIGVSLNDPSNPVSNCGGLLFAEDGGNTISLVGGAVAAKSTCSASVAITLLEEGEFTIFTSDLSSTAGFSEGVSATIGNQVDGPALRLKTDFVESPIALGGQTKLVYSVTNLSESAAEEIAFSDDLSPGIVIASQPNISNSCLGSTISATPGSQNMRLTGGYLEPGETCVISFDVVGVVSGKNISLTGEITSKFAEGETVSSGVASSVLEVISPEDLAEITFTKEFTAESVDPGRVEDLVFTLTNNSQSETYSNISFIDDLDEMLPGALAVRLPEEGGFFVDASFDNNGVSVLRSSWNYLNQIQNENGRNDSYPIDQDGISWNESSFNIPSSSVGPWSVGDAPFQAGAIDAFSSFNTTNIGGIDSAANGQNLVTTYLFRQDFDLNDAQASLSEWIFNYLFDDGAVIYINGVEVFRTASMPEGSIQTTTLADVGDETAYSLAQINLSGVLKEGPNTIAVELHQSSLESSDAGFGLELFPASDSPSAEFAYFDNTFENTSDEGSADGMVEEDGGFAGRGLSVVLGGKNFITGFLNPQSSGGWKRTFQISEPQLIKLSLRYRLTIDASYEENEYGQALLEINGARYGDGPGTSLSQLNGGAGVGQDTGWKLYTTSILFGAGSHTILVGGYNNQSNQGSEVTRVFFDDIQIGSPVKPASVCGPESQIVGSDVLTFTGGELKPGESCSFRVGIKIPETASFGIYQNRTSLLTLNAEGRPLMGLPAADFLEIEPLTPVFTAQFSQPNIAKNQTSNLIFVIDNRESFVEANNVGFTYDLPDGLIIAEPLRVTSECGGVIDADVTTGLISFSEGSVSPGGICSVSVEVLATRAGRFESQSSPLISSVGNSGSASALLVVSPPPVFSMSISPETIDAGQPAILTYTIDNSASEIPATELSFTQVLPLGLVIASPPGLLSSCQGGFFNVVGGAPQFSYTQGVVPARETCQISLRVTGNEGGGYQITSNELSSSLGASGSASSSMVIRPIVSIGVSVDSLAEGVIAGSSEENHSYIIKARNEGPSSASEILIQTLSEVPDGVLQASSSVSRGTYDKGVWKIPELLPGEEVFLIVTYTVPSFVREGEGVISKTAALIGVDQTEINEGDNTSTKISEVKNVFDLSLSSFLPTEPVVAGSGEENLRFSMELANSGPSDATDIVIGTNFELPAGVRVVSIISEKGEYRGDDSQGGEWTVNLPRGEKDTLTFVMTVDANAPLDSSILSGVNFLSATGIDYNTSNDSVSGSIGISRKVEFEVTAESSRVAALAGFDLPKNLSHSFTVTNQGPSDASGVVFNVESLFPDEVDIDSTSVNLSREEGEQAWIIGDLGVGESASLKIYFDIPRTVTSGIDLISSYITLKELNEVLPNISDVSESISTDVLSAQSVLLSHDGKRLDFQTGLLTQTVTVRNENHAALEALRIVVSGLPEGVKIHNAQGSIDGDGFLLYNQALASGQNIDLTVEYFQLDASGGFEPTFEVQLIEPTILQNMSQGTDVDRCEVLSNGNVLIEFPAEIDSIYTVEYSANGVDWAQVTPSVRAGGNRVQWIDNGPPKTETHPSAEKVRLYRVIKR